MYSGFYGYPRPTWSSFYDGPRPPYHTMPIGNPVPTTSPVTSSGSGFPAGLSYPAQTSVFYPPETQGGHQSPYPYGFPQQRLYKEGYVENTPPWWLYQ